MALRKKSNTFFRVGLPFVVFVVGGFVGLSQFVGGKFEIRDMRVKSQSVRAFNLEEEHDVSSLKLTFTSNFTKTC